MNIKSSVHYFGHGSLFWIFVYWCLWKHWVFAGVSELPLKAGLQKAFPRFSLFLATLVGPVVCKCRVQREYGWVDDTKFSKVNPCCKLQYLTDELP